MQPFDFLDFRFSSEQGKVLHRKSKSHNFLLKNNTFFKSCSLLLAFFIYNKDPNLI